MGCSNSKQAALHELEANISQLTDENNQLKNDLEKLNSLKKTPGSGSKPPTVQHIRSLFKLYECNLKSLNEIGQTLFEFSKTNLLPSSSVSEIVEYSETLTKKLTKLDSLIKEKDKLKTEEEALEFHISTLEDSIKTLEAQYFTSEESRNEHHLLHEKVSELQTKKEEILQEIQESEEELEKLNQDIKNSGLDDKSANDLSNYEVLMRMGELEVNIELKKIDSELEVLANEMKELKLREGELQSMEAIVSSRSVSRADNREIVPFQIKKSRERAEMLEADQMKLKSEIGIFKRSSLVEKGKEDRTDVFRDFAQKKLKKEEDGKGVFEKIEMRMQASLNRVLAKGFVNK